MDPSPPSPASPDPSEWVDEFGDTLFRYAVARLRDVHAAEEVVQETFLAGIRHRNQYQGRGTIQAWLLGVLKRKIIDHIRKQSRQESATPFDEDRDLTSSLFNSRGHWNKSAVTFAKDPSQRLQSAELWDVVRDCLQDLPGNQADAFVLSVMEDLPTAEVCDALGISESNLWVRLHRARLRLASCVGPRWRTE